MVELAAGGVLVVHRTVVDARHRIKRRRREIAFLAHDAGREIAKPQGATRLARKIERHGAPREKPEAARDQVARGRLELRMERRHEQPPLSIAGGDERRKPLHRERLRIRVLLDGAGERRQHLEVVAVRHVPGIGGLKLRAGVVRHKVQPRRDAHQLRRTRRELDLHHAVAAAHRGLLRVRDNPHQSGQVLRERAACAGAVVAAALAQEVADLLHACLAERLGLPGAAPARHHEHVQAIKPAGAHIVALQPGEVDLRRMGEVVLPTEPPVAAPAAPDVVAHLDLRLRQRTRRRHRHHAHHDLPHFAFLLRPVITGPDSPRSLPPTASGTPRCGGTSRCRARRRDHP